MIYEFYWSRSSRVSRVATSDCKVVEADKALSTFINKPLSTLIGWAGQRGIRHKAVSAYVSLSDHEAKQNVITKSAEV